MNLLLDIGNSRVKWALARAGVLVETGATRRDESIGWTNALPRAQIRALYVASVAHDSAIEALAMHARANGMPLHRVRSRARSGRLVNGYTEPECLGVDRWMACIAAEARGPGSVLVADVGTALTLDWIDAHAHHGGGLIAPGVTSMRSALRASTQLRPSYMPAVQTGLARDSDSAIATGTLRCAIALLNATAQELAPDRLLLTGGEAEMIAPKLTRPWTLAPQLVLEGLALHAEREAEGSQPARQTSK